MDVSTNLFTNLEIKQLESFNTLKILKGSTCWKSGESGTMNFEDDNNLDGNVTPLTSHFKKGVL